MRQKQVNRAIATMPPEAFPLGSPDAGPPWVRLISSTAMLAAKSSIPAATLARRVGKATKAGCGVPTFWSMVLSTSTKNCGAIADGTPGPWWKLPTFLHGIVGPCGRLRSQRCQNSRASRLAGVVRAKPVEYQLQVIVDPPAAQRHRGDFSFAWDIK